MRKGYLLVIIFNVLYFYGYFISTGRLDIWNDKDAQTRVFAGIMLVFVSFVIILMQILINSDKESN